MKFESKHKRFHASKCSWKCRLRNGGHFIVPMMVVVVVLGGGGWGWGWGGGGVGGQFTMNKLKIWHSLISSKYTEYENALQKLDKWPQGNDSTNGYHETWSIKILPLLTLILCVRSFNIDILPYNQQSRSCLWNNAIWWPKFVVNFRGCWYDMDAFY